MHQSLFIYTLFANHYFFLNGFNKRFADYRATYMFKRQKNRTGITYCAITHVVIIAGLVFERLFTNLHYATMFTFFSSALVILGVSIALDRLPASATRPRASDEDRNDVIEFIKTRADMLLAYYSRANQKNYKESIESAVRSTSKFFHQTVETPKTRQLLVYVLLSLTFMGVEVTYGISKGNLSLISAGAHMFFDSFGLIVGLFASYVAKQAPNRSYSYGYGRIKVLSFFVNGVMLLIVSVTVLVESLLHVLSGATEAHSPMFLLISLVGLLIHLIGVIFFHEHSNILKNALRHRDNETRPGNGGRHDTSNAQSNSSSEDMNLRGIFIHVMVDTVSSLGLVISTIFVQIYNYDICDPICSIIISVLTFKSVLPQMGKSLRILLQGSAFSEAETSAFQSRLTELASAETSGPSSGVAHYAAVCTSFCVWAQTPGYVVATATLCISQDANEQHILVAATRFLKSKGITSSCIECIKHPVDTPLASPCLPSVNPQELSISTNVENKK